MGRSESGGICWVLGGGRMGQAFLSGILKKGWQNRPEKVFVCDPDPGVRERLSGEGTVDVVSSVDELVREGEKSSPSLVFWAVKPSLFSGLAAVLRSLDISPLGVSVMAGTPLSTLQESLPRWRWIRTMSNLALTRGEGMTLLTPGARAEDEDLSAVSRIFLELGRVMMLPEKDFDVATALAGSGPGLMALVLEALSDAGVRHGLKREDAVFLSAQMLKGTASLILEEGMDPSELRKRVASPSGTTIEGLVALEEGGVRASFIQAVARMVGRSSEMSVHSRKEDPHSHR
ncbi:pyrroline-5-carboxylate reductase [Leptospirillum ferriphilum]|nr:pyrroline-5-carboxylate reductase [Leptospirillum ferriphilum]